MTKPTLLIFLVALFSIIAVFATLYLPKTIFNINELNNILCGWPLPFIEFDSSKNPPNEWTDSCINWVGSPMDWNGKVLWIPFFLNVILAFSTVWVIFFSLKKMFKKNK